MADLVLRTREDVEALVLGCTFYGTGGGGNPTLGQHLLPDDLARLGEIRISDPSDILDDAWVCTPYLMGSIAPRTDKALADMAKLGLTKRMGMADHIALLALMELESYARVEVEAFVPIELGGANTPVPIDLALSFGKKVVNGDYAGRAIPEIVQITTYLADKPAHPTAYVDEWGNVSIIKTVVNCFLAEAHGHLAGAGFLMRAKEMKEVLIPNTQSECLLAGQTIRHAAATKKDSGETVAEAPKGWVLFRGRVSKR